jgi:DNA replicative helicase MCM subunit Mcm2 (Cdc46/Mcm family)
MEEEIKTHTLKEELCNNCGAEYTLTYDHENEDAEPIYCPFCSEEHEDYILEEEELEELDFDKE